MNTRDVMNAYKKEEKTNEENEENEEQQENQQYNDLAKLYVW